jgi:hypothetical protein
MNPNEGLSPEQKKELVTPKSTVAFLSLKRPLIKAPVSFFYEQLEELAFRADIYGGIKNAPEDFQQEYIGKNQIIMEEIAARN